MEKCGRSVGQGILFCVAFSSVNFSFSIDFIYSSSCMVTYKLQNIPQAWLLSREKESYATLKSVNYNFLSVQTPWRGEWTYIMCHTSSVMTYLTTSEATFTSWEGQQEREIKVKYTDGSRARWSELAGKRLQTRRRVQQKMQDKLHERFSSVIA